MLRKRNLRRLVISVLGHRRSTPAAKRHSRSAPCSPAKRRLPEALGGPEDGSGTRAAPRGNSPVYFSITARWQRFSHGGGSFRPRPPIACCTHAGLDTSRRAHGSHPPPPPRCVRKEFLKKTGC